MIKDKLTAKEFQQLLNRGIIQPAGKRLKTVDLSPEFLSVIDKMDGIFIPGEVYSSKNSKQIYRKRVNGKTTSFITDSPQVKKYKKDHSTTYVNLKNEFLDQIKDKSYPVVIEFTFYRKTLQRFDFTNMVQIVADMMVKHGWLPDDSMKYFLPVPPLPPKSPFFHSKDKPGVLIKVL